MTFGPDPDSQPQKVSGEHTTDAQVGLPSTVEGHSQALNAWTEDHLTEAQLRWFANETGLLRGVVAKITRESGAAPRLCDIGCGMPDRLFRSDELGAIIDDIKHYTGIDNEFDTIRAARETYGDKGTFMDAGDYADVLNTLPSERFDLLVCLGNTLGTLPGDRQAHVLKMAEHTDTLFISVVRKGPDVLRARIGYYEKNNINCHINWDTNVIHSETWGDSLAFGEKELAEFENGLKSKGFRNVQIHQVEPLGATLVAFR